jgi:hypothetical protein
MAAPVINPGGVRQPAARPFTVRSATQPANPAGGGHYVKLPGGQNLWQAIHAVGPGQWAPGPPKAKPAPPATTPATQPVSNAYTVTASSRPANPDTGGHYVKTAAGWQLIHATGPGKWAPGPPPLYSQPLYQPTQVLRGQALANAAKQLTGIQYNPAINQLTQQIAQNAQQGAGAEKATAGYFDQLGQYAQQSQQDVANTGQGLSAQLQNIGAGTQTALDQIGQQAASPALQALAAQGLGGGATDQLAAQIAALKGTAAARSAADQSYGAKVGANAATLAGENLGTYALRGQERLGQIAAATRLAAQPLETQLATQRVNKAAAYSTNLQAARQQQFNNLVATQGLNLRQQGITSAAATAAANRAAAQQRTAAQQAGATQRALMGIDARATQGRLDRQSRQQIAAANRAARAAIAAGRTSAKAGQPASPSAQRTMWKEITGIQGRVRWLQAAIGGWTGATPASTRSQAWHALNTGRLYAPYQQPQLDSSGHKTGKTVQKWHWVNIPPVGDTPMLNAAFYSINGGLTPGDVAYLHSIGFTIGNLMPIAQTGVGKGVSKGGAGSLSF